MTNMERLCKHLEDNKLDAKDLKLVQKLVMEDMKAISKLSEADIVSMYSFFKILASKIKDKSEHVFLTPVNSFVYKNRKEIEKNTGISIKAYESSVVKRKRAVAC